MPFPYYPSLEALKLRTMSIRVDPISTLKERREKRERESKKEIEELNSLKNKFIYFFKTFVSFKSEEEEVIKMHSKDLAIVSKTISIEFFRQKKGI